MQVLLSNNSLSYKKCKFVKEIGTKRTKRRYILIQIIFYSQKHSNTFTTDSSITKDSLKDILFHHFGETYGRMFIGLLCALKIHSVLFFNKKTKLFILSIPRDLGRFVKSAIPLMKKIKNYECCLQMVYCSGVLNKVKAKCIEYYKNQIKMVNEGCTKDEIDFVCNQVMNLDIKD